MKTKINDIEKEILLIGKNIVIGQYCTADLYLSQDGEIIIVEPQTSKEKEPGLELIDMCYCLSQWDCKHLDEIVKSEAGCSTAFVLFLLNFDRDISENAFEENVNKQFRTVNLHLRTNETIY